MYGYGYPVVSLGVAGTGLNPPVNTVAPAITGTATVGQTLSCSTGTWNNSPDTYAYQWKRNNVDILGATLSTYTLVTADGGTSVKCTVTATNGAGSAAADSNTVSVPVPFDADAQAFITAAGITDPTQQSAIDQLVVDLKGYNIWTKMKAIYPFIGGTSTTHKWNLKDPRDLDAAFRLTFSGGWTHSSTGAKPNGTNAYADTFLNVNSALSNTSHAFNFYLNSNNDANVRGTLGAYTDNSNSLDSYNFSGGVYYRSGQGSNIGAPTNNGKGFFGLSRRNASNFDMLKQDGTYITTGSIPTYTSINKSILLGNINGISFFAIQSQAYVSISEGLTQSEMTNLRTAVINFQTTLGRNV